LATAIVGGGVRTELFPAINGIGRQNRAQGLQSEREPTSQAELLQVWQIDFKDVTAVTPEPEGKRRHQVETLNMLDIGTSILVDNPARTDFNAETVIETVAQTLQSVAKVQQLP
jgi:hypothetical protein